MSGSCSVIWTRYYVYPAGVSSKLTSNCDVAKMEELSHQGALLFCSDAIDLSPVSVALSVCLLDMRVRVSLWCSALFSSALVIAGSNNLSSSGNGRFPTMITLGWGVFQDTVYNSKQKVEELR
jgi:hypothetical protein